MTQWQVRYTDTESLISEDPRILGMVVKPDLMG